MDAPNSIEHDEVSEDTPIGQVSEDILADNASSTVLNTIVLHDSGDITLLVGSGKVQQPVLVSSPVLQIASPVWKAMCGEHWKESEAHEIPLPDDDVEAMLIVLRIVHLKFHDLPEKKGMSFDTLYKLAIVCDKYDLVQVVRPFLDLHCWAQSYIYPTHTRSHHPAWLFVAWTFGYTESFEALACDMVNTVTVGSDGFMYDQSEGLIDEVFPLDIIASISRVRETALSSMLDCCYTILDNIRTSTCQINDNDRDLLDDKKCQAIIFGSYVTHLITLGLYPVKKSGADMQLSVNNFKNELLQFQVLTYDSLNYQKITQMDKRKHSVFESRVERVKKEVVISHANCGQVVNLKTAIDEVVSQMHSPVLESHLRHMEEQAKK